MELTSKQRSLLYNNFTLSTESFMKEEIDINAEDIDTFIAIKDEKMVGWATVTGWTKEWKLFMVFINPRYRKRGIALKLAKTVKGKYKNIGMIRNDDNRNFVNIINNIIGIYIEEL